jgi:uncharacterized protein (TIGR02646 family)
MKKISKTYPPTEYLQWLKCQEQLGIKDKLQFNYDTGIDREPFDALKKKLIEEQGYLCAYTGMKILPDIKNIDGQITEIGTFHIEHLKPRTLCKQEQKDKKKVLSEDLDYQNIVACYPKDENDTPCSFGAKLKDDWWDEKEFISPCQDDCERRFSFSWNGNVSSTIDEDHAAKKTIEILGLNKVSKSKSHENNQTGEYHIHDRRRDVIQAYFRIGKNLKTKMLTKKQAEFLLRNIYEKDANGHLQEFCFVLKQLLERHIK